MMIFNVTMTYVAAPLAILIMWWAAVTLFHFAFMNHSGNWACSADKGMTRTLSLVVVLACVIGTGGIIQFIHNNAPTITIQGKRPVEQARH